MCFEKIFLSFLVTQLYFSQVYDIFTNIMMEMASMRLRQNGAANIPCKDAYG